MSAVDRELGYAGGKAYAALPGKATAVLLFALETGELACVLEADTAGQRRTAASGVAAKHLARRGATTLGVIGCGWARRRSRIRAAVPAVEQVVAHCRTPARLRVFCERVGAEPAESHAEAAVQDIVTITTSRDPVLRGEWLREDGALVCAAGANDRRKRELDNVVLESGQLRLLRLQEDARIESGDLLEPVESGVLDWLEVHELRRSSPATSRDAPPTPTSSSSSRTGSPLGTWRSGPCQRRRAGARRRQSI